jgi:predicted alpha/beta hydrolase
MAPATEAAEVVVLEGGPLDGREHPVEPNTAELMVAMADGAEHRYVRSGRRLVRRDGNVLPVFEYRGRRYPLRSAGQGS